MAPQGSRIDLYQALARQLRADSIRRSTAAGSLGEAALAALAAAGAAGELVHFVHLAVRDMPGSGKPAELVETAKISARYIADVLEELARTPRREQDIAST